jgi:hypothetical protein
MSTGILQFLRMEKIEEEREREAIRVTDHPLELHGHCIHKRSLILAVFNLKAFD